MSEIVNIDQARAWDGEDGARWTRDADRYDAAIVDYHEALLDAAAIAPGESVLDIGCGCGWSAVVAARASGTGAVLGVDLSTEMLGVARERAAADALDHLRFERGDAQVHPFPDAAFDVAISSFGTMFFTDYEAAFTNIARALRPGGRIVLSVWTPLERNEWVTLVRETLAAGRELSRPAVGTPGPFGLADAALVTSHLEAAGFRDVARREVEAWFRPGADADDALAFLRSTGQAVGLTETLDDATRDAVLAQLHHELACRAGPEGVTLGSSAWIVSATRA